MLVVGAWDLAGTNAPLGVKHKQGISRVPGWWAGGVACWDVAGSSFGSNFRCWTQCPDHTRSKMSVLLVRKKPPLPKKILYFFDAEQDERQGGAAQRSGPAYPCGEQGTH